MMMFMNRLGGGGIHDDEDDGDKDYLSRWPASCISGA